MQSFSCWMEESAGVPEGGQVERKRKRKRGGEDASRKKMMGMLEEMMRV